MRLVLLLAKPRFMLIAECSQPLSGRDTGMTSDCCRIVLSQPKRHAIRTFPQSFTDKSKITIASGLYQGCQAIVFEPETPEAPKLEPDCAKSLTFMDLPTELRLKIYQMLFEDNDPVILQSKQPPTFTTTPPHFFSRTSLAIASVCRQIRFEVIPIIFGERTFQIDCPHVPDLVVEKFLLNIGASRKHLRFLEIGRYADSHWSRPDMFNRLLTCPNLRRIHFRVHAIGKTPEDYAKFFYKSARLWLNVVAHCDRVGPSGLEVISFSNLPECWPGSDWNERGGSKLRAMVKALIENESSQ